MKIMLFLRWYIFNAKGVILFGSKFFKLMLSFCSVWAKTHNFGNNGSFPALVSVVSIVVDKTIDQRIIGKRAKFVC